MRQGWSALTVLYSPSMTSSDSVDLAVTFSLPGVPASSSSICQTKRRFQDFLKNTSIHCRYPACFTLTASQTPTHLCGDIFAEELYSMLLHTFSSTIGHVLVKAPQQNGPNHDGDIETQASKEPPALQSHIRGPDHQGLSRAVRQWEQVITRQGVIENTSKRWRFRD